MTNVFIKNQENNQFKNIIISSKNPYIVPVDAVSFEKVIIKFSDDSIIGNDYIQNKNGKWDMILKIISEKSSFYAQGHSFKTLKTLEVIGAQYLNSNFNIKGN